MPGPLNRPFMSRKSTPHGAVQRAPCLFGYQVLNGGKIQLSYAALSSNLNLLQVLSLQLLLQLKFKDPTVLELDKDASPQLHQQTQPQQPLAGTQAWTLWTKEGPNCLQVTSVPMRDMYQNDQKVVYHTEQHSRHRNLSISGSQEGYRVETYGPGIKWAISIMLVLSVTQVKPKSLVLMVKLRGRRPLYFRTGDQMVNRPWPWTAGLEGHTIPRQLASPIAWASSSPTFRRWAKTSHCSRKCRNAQSCRWRTWRTSLQSIDEDLEQGRLEKMSLWVVLDSQHLKFSGTTKKCWIKILPVTMEKHLMIIVISHPSSMIGPIQIIQVHKLKRENCKVISAGPGKLPVRSQTPALTLSLMASKHANQYQATWILKVLLIA